MFQMALNTLAWSGHSFAQMSQYHIEASSATQKFKLDHQRSKLKVKMISSVAILAWGHTTDVLYSARDNQHDEK